MRLKGTRLSGQRLIGMRPNGMRPNGMRPNGMRPNGMRLKGYGSRERGLKECVLAECASFNLASTDKLYRRIHVTREEKKAMGVELKNMERNCRHDGAPQDWKQCRALVHAPREQTGVSKYPCAHTHTIMHARNIKHTRTHMNKKLL